MTPLFALEKIAQEKINEDNLKVLHLIDGNPRISQRGVAQEFVS